jgi:hypothetical protein
MKRIMKKLWLSIWLISFALLTACSSRIPIKDPDIELAKEKAKTAGSLQNHLTQQLAIISEKYFENKKKETIAIAVLPFRTDKEDTTVLTQALSDTISKDISRRIQFKIPESAKLETAKDKFQIYQVGWTDDDILMELAKFLEVDVFVMGIVKETLVGGAPFYQIEFMAKDAALGQSVLSNSFVIAKKQFFSDLNFTEISTKTLVEKEGFQKGSVRIIYRTDDPLARFQSTPQKLLTKFDYSYEQFTASKENPHELIAVDSSCSIDGISKVPDSDGYCMARTLRSGTYKVTFSYLLKQLVGEIYEEVGIIHKTFKVEVGRGEKISILVQNAPELTPPSVNLKAWKTVGEEKIPIQVTAFESGED